MKEGLHLGLDVGSGTAKGIILNKTSQLLFSHYEATRGRPLKVAHDILKHIESQFAKEQIETITCTGTGGKKIASLIDVAFVNEVICHTKAVEFFHPEAKTIIDIGGEDAKLILVKHSHDNSFYIQDFALNTVCAAGTGAFLEQQANRLGYTIQEFSQQALKAEHIPSIAGRCTVFAKSDMIHLQQNGMADYEIIAGLCFAIVRNLKTNIAKGKKIVPPLVFQGGVAANLGVRRAMRELLVSEDRELIIPEHFNVMGGIGAALEGLKGNTNTSYPGRDKLFFHLSQELRDTDRLSPLKVEKSWLQIQSPLNKEYSQEKGSSIDKANASDGAYLGIDVGSVTTKLALIKIGKNTHYNRGGKENFQVLAKTYLPTEGKPLEALKRGLSDLYEQLDQEVKIVAVGSTGSGRYLCGHFVGADIVRNEITAQAEAAASIDPKVDTIFEVGGQDSKYIRLENEAVVDFSMNKVCAAGTGSFLEEQSVRLGIEVKEFGELSLSALAPVKMGERCTVFMQSDLVHYQQRGASKPDLAAGLCYSIVANYLNKVVEHRKIGERIFFQGGTALNKGIVAAFEEVLERGITVPKHNEVTGAIGAALIAAREFSGKTNFKGFDLRHRKYETEFFECQGCTNHCEVQKIFVQGEMRPFFFGHRCERYEKEKKSELINQPDLLREREQILTSFVTNQENQDNSQIKIGIPRTLFFQEWLPFFSSLFQSLGYQVVLSEATNKKLVGKGSNSMVTETCLPIKAAHGHVLNLMEKGIKRIFLPQICDFPLSKTQDDSGKVCPYVQGLPWTIRSALDLDSHDTKLLSPVFHLGGNRKVREREWKEFAKVLGISWLRMRRALNVAWNAQERFYQLLRQRGEEILQGLQKGERVILLVGRPYNALDPGINMDLSRKLRKLNVLALPMDFLPLEEENTRQELQDMYWAYGRKILAAGYFINRNPNVFPVFITNFSCGPDAFILHFFEKLIGDRPFLELEIDEHTADAGVVTRLEAFWDSIQNISSKSKAGSAPFVTFSPRYRKDHILYIPPMTDHLQAFTAAFAANGVDARLIPYSDEESLRLGRKYTKGKECLPAVLTTGDIVKTVQKRDFEPERSAFFMPAARGPCRFGLYNHYHRLVLDGLGFSNVPVYAPNQSYTLYEELGIVGKDFAKLAWKGVVAVDILIKFLQETRPYVQDKEECTSIYKDYLAKITNAIYHDQDLEPIISEASDTFYNLPKATHKRKPIVGIVGEIYVRSNPFANEFIVQALEDLGVEVWLPSIGEWIHYINYMSKIEAWRQGDLKRWFKMFMEIKLQNRIENKLLGSCNGWLRSIPEPSTQELLEQAKPFISPQFEGEAILSVGKSMEYIHQDVQGLVNVIPFTCMPGGVVDAIFNRIKKVRNIPMLTVAFDGQRDTNTKNRLEAFVYQIQQNE